jgi:hypothetical protein
VGLLVLLFRSGAVQLGQVIQTVRNAKPLPVLGAFILYAGAGTLVRGIRWQTLVRGLGHELSLRRATEIFLMGVTFNQVLPTGIGGDVVRSLILGREGMGKARAASTVVVERGQGMLALLVVGMLVLPFARDEAPPVVAAILAGFGSAGLVVGLLLTRADALRRWATRLPGLGRAASHGGIARFIDSFAEYGYGPLAAAFAWSVAFAAVMIGTNWLLGAAFGIDQAGAKEWAIVTPLVALSLLVPSIGGLGVREWSYVGLLGALHPPAAPEAATALSLTFQGLNLVMALMGGILVLAEGRDVTQEALGERLDEAGQAP